LPSWRFLDLPADGQESDAKEPLLAAMTEAAATCGRHVESRTSKRMPREPTPWHATQRAAWDALRTGQYLTDAKSMTGTVPANLPAAPIFKHPEQEDEAEGGVLVTIREDAPLDFRARACNNRLGVRGGRRTSGRRADSAHRSHAGGWEQYSHDGEDHSCTKGPHWLASR
jgi:hypothetical protein